MKFPLALLLVVSSCVVAHTTSAQTPVLRYTFDDSANPTADSGSGTAAPGSIGGSGTFVTDTPGGFSAAAFSTAGGAEGSAVFTTGAPAKLNDLANFTLTFWVNLRANPGNNDRLFTNRNGASPSSTEGFFELTTVTPDNGTLTPSDLRLQLVVDDGPNQAGYFTTDFSLGGTNAWAFVAVTYLGAGTSGNAVNFYLGGVTTAATALAKGTNGAGIGTVTASTGPAAVADLPNFTGDRTPNAYFDDVRVYDTALTQAQIDSVRLANVVPEPGSVLLLSAGAVGLLGLRRRGATA